jgi:hypothetical protein
MNPPNRIGMLAEKSDGYPETGFLKRTNNIYHLPKPSKKTKHRNGGHTLEKLEKLATFLDTEQYSQEYQQKLDEVQKLSENVIKSFGNKVGNLKQAERKNKRSQAIWNLANKYKDLSYLGKKEESNTISELGSSNVQYTPTQQEKLEPEVKSLAIKNYLESPPKVEAQNELPVYLQSIKKFSSEEHAEKAINEIVKYREECKKKNNKISFSDNKILEKVGEIALRDLTKYENQGSTYLTTISPKPEEKIIPTNGTLEQVISIPQKNQLTIVPTTNQQETLEEKISIKDINKKRNQILNEFIEVYATRQEEACQKERIELSYNYAEIRIAESLHERSKKIKYLSQKKPSLDLLNRVTNKLMDISQVDDKAVAIENWYSTGKSRKLINKSLVYEMFGVEEEEKLHEKAVKLYKNTAQSIKESSFMKYTSLLFGAQINPIELKNK